jgi:cleft lip and palate transmembrane protein 1 (CLPTM1)
VLDLSQQHPALYQHTSRYCLARYSVTATAPHPSPSTASLHVTPCNHCSLQLRYPSHRHDPSAPIPDYFSICASRSTIYLYLQVFDVLAFKNDISFWKENKSMRGLSAKAILLSCGMQVPWCSSHHFSPPCPTLDVQFGDLP